MCRGELYARIYGTATSIRSKVNTMMANFKTLTYVTITIATLLCAAGEHFFPRSRKHGTVQCSRLRQRPAFSFFFNIR